MSLVRFRFWAYGVLAQSVEHLTFNQVVPGSNPGTLIDAQIAQLVEQRTENPRVVGSIPTLGTDHIAKRSLRRCSSMVEH